MTLQLTQSAMGGEGAAGRNVKQETPPVYWNEIEMHLYKFAIFGRETNIWKSGIWGWKNLNLKKIAFKVVQIKFLAMHIKN